MTLLRPIGVLTLLCLSSCATVDDPPATDADPLRQVLVMLKAENVLHYRPGAPVGAGYDDGRIPTGERRTARALAEEYDLDIVDQWPMPALALRCFVAQVGVDRSPAAVAQRLASDPRVESAQPMQIFRTLEYREDYSELQNSGAAWRLGELHRMATGNNVRIAQIDTGVQVTHPDLRGRLLEARNFVSGSHYAGEAHGTAVAGIIAANDADGIGIVGVAPRAMVMPLRACRQNPGENDAVCTSFTLAKALQHAIQRRARVVNFSLSGPYDRLLERLIQQAIANGAIVVAAVDPAVPETSFPASVQDVIPVASAHARGANPRAVRAPGNQILTTAPGSAWGFVSGSSYAAAHVSGVTALMLERSPSLRAPAVAAALKAYTRPADEDGIEGIVDACAALASISSDLSCPCCPNPSGRELAPHRAQPSS